MQAFGIIAGTQQLHGCKKSGDVFILLIANILTNAFMNRYRAAFKLDNCHGDTVDINDQIRAAVAFALYGNLLGNLKIILHRVCPVDQMHRLFALRHIRLNVHTVTQQRINLPVGIVLTGTDIRRRLFEFRYGFVDLLVGIFPPFQITEQQCLFDIAVACAVLPVSEIVVFQYVLKQPDKPLLRHPFLCPDI